MISKTEALQAMKARRGEETIILFHNGEFFEAYEQDATVVATVAGLASTVIDGVLTVRIAETEQEEISNTLLDAGCAICISEMRDSDGNFIVNVNQTEDYEQDE